MYGVPSVLTMTDAANGEVRAIFRAPIGFFTRKALFHYVAVNST